MPNVGKPSKGCQNCRDRKAKCDLKRPSCSQCIRLGMDCHGYRDPLSMMFKNENTVVKNRAQKRYAELSTKKMKNKTSFKGLPTASETSSDDTSTSSRSPRSSSTVSQSENPTKPITLSVENEALNFFAANNIFESAIAGRSNYRWLFQMLSGSKNDATLQSSAHAVSLATLATARKSQALMIRAQQYYARALALTNKALRDSTKVYEDSTLVSVIMLGVYEDLVFERHSLRAWVHHLKGAGMLFVMRGEVQFRSNLARQIFLQFYRTHMRKSLELGNPIPENIKQLYRHLTSLRDHTMHGVEHQIEVMEKAIALMHDENRNPVTIVFDALKLDGELDSIKFLLQTLWRYETVYLDKSAESVFGYQYHIYTDPLVINMWNILRTCRVRLFKFIRAQVDKAQQHSPPLFSSEDAQAHINTCKAVISSQMLDMCASTPQLTGQIAFPRQIKRDLDFFKGGVETVNLRHKMFTVHPQGTFLEPFKSTALDHLIGPLYEIGRSDFGPRLTQWAVDQLFFIAGKIGSRKAVIMAEELKEKLKDESNFQVWHDPCPTSAQLAALAI